MNMRYALSKKQSFRDKDVSEWEICLVVCCGKVNNWQCQKQQKYDSKACENNKENYITQTKYIYVHTQKFFRKCHAVDIVVSKGSSIRFCADLDRHLIVELSNSLATDEWVIGGKS
jgi:hypothetical protein